MANWDERRLFTYIWYIWIGTSFNFNLTFFCEYFRLNIDSLNIQTNGTKLYKRTDRFVDIEHGEYTDWWAWKKLMFID